MHIHIHQCRIQRKEKDTRLITPFVESRPAPLADSAIDRLRFDGAPIHEHPLFKTGRARKRASRNESGHVDPAFAFRYRDHCIRVIAPEKFTDARDQVFRRRTCDKRASVECKFKADFRVR